MRRGGLILFFASSLFGLGAEYSMGETWLSENSFWLMMAGMMLGLSWALFDFWPKALNFWHRNTWLDMEAAGRFYRDLCVKNKMSDAVTMFDEMSKHNQGKDPKDSIKGAFRTVAQFGVNEGQMEVWGVPENGSASEKITHADDDMTSYVLARNGDSDCLAMNGVRYRNLKFRRSGIKSYVLHIREHDGELKGRPQEGQN